MLHFIVNGKLSLPSISMMSFDIRIISRNKIKWFHEVKLNSMFPQVTLPNTESCSENHFFLLLALKRLLTEDLLKDKIYFVHTPKKEALRMLIINWLHSVIIDRKKEFWRSLFLKENWGTLFWSDLVSYTLLEQGIESITKRRVFDFKISWNRPKLCTISNFQSFSSEFLIHFFTESNLNSTSNC